MDKETREKLDGLLESYFADAGLSLEELWPDMDNPENREYFNRKVSKVRRVILDAILGDDE